MPPSKIMIIRHGEKPEAHGIEGVDRRGEGSDNDLTVRGWQRAGALARFFAPLAERHRHPDLAQPKHLFAATSKHGSRRAVQTITPLAALLDIQIDESLGKEDSAALCEAMRKLDGPVLIAWEHKAIADILRDWSGGALPAPDWPGDRFDMVFVLTGIGSDTRLIQVPQMLLAGDRETPLTAGEA